MKTNELKETILIDDEYFGSLLKDIQNSKKCIFLEAYIFDDDEVGNKILNELCHAARRDVEIKIIVDGFGSSHWSLDMSNRLIDAGGLIKIYHPLPWKFQHWKLTSYLSDSILGKFIHFLKVINSRNHRKMCIIDHRIIYIGSANISADPKMGNSIKWYDINVRIENNPKEPEKAFYAIWNHKMLTRFENTSMEKLAIYRINNTKKKRKLLYRDLVGKIINSKKRIWIISPFFVSYISFVAALIKAANSGVDVRIIMPSCSDVAIIPFLTKYHYNFFLKSKVKLMEYPPSAVLHCKVIVIDDWFCVGSTNVNNRSLLHDLEIDVSLQTSLAKRTLEAEVKRNFEISMPILHQMIGDQSLLIKIIGRLLIFIKYWC